MFSNNVHISTVKKIQIGDGCLFGSNIYIGDHSHGSTDPALYDSEISPALRPLSDINEIIINDNVWVCDGVVILAGANIGKGCIVGANSIVKGSFPDNCLIAGIPAKVIKRLNK
ncbi:Maltose O-acetyltransferase [Pragia fontium]|nr:Maltose O-acetyltransferase [Pragia fontium]